MTSNSTAVVKTRYNDFLQREVQKFAEDTKDMTREDLLELSLMLDEDMTQIRAQLQDARMRAQETHGWRDTGWYNRALTALHLKRLHRHHINKRLAELRQAVSMRDERLFVRIAKLVLDPETYARIWAEVHRTTDVEDRVGNT